MKIHTLLSTSLLTACTICCWGQLSFIDKVQPNLLPTFSNDVDFADVDGDGDLDFIMAGLQTFGRFEPAELYLNDGSGLFSRALNTNFPSIQQPGISFADIDGDSDLDLLINGFNMAFFREFFIYENDGNGNFTDITASTGLDSLPSGYYVDFADIDLDGDQDLILTGGGHISREHAELYFNNGSGFFTKDTQSTLVGVRKGSVDFADVDNDNDPDLLITGIIGVDSISTFLYKNDGTGKFNIQPIANLAQVWRGAAGFADVDGDNDLDLITSGKLGFPGNKTVSTELYLNDGAGNFSPLANPAINQSFFTSFDFGDVDNDGDVDFMAIDSAVTRLFINDGAGIYTESLAGFFFPVSGIVALKDFNNDSKTDVLLSGFNSSDSHAKVYLNQSILSTLTPELDKVVFSHYISADNYLHIDLKENHSDVHLQLLSMDGKLILDQHKSDVDHLEVELGPRHQALIAVLKADGKWQTLKVVK